MQVHRIAGHIQNIYLVQYPDKLLLLDGLCRADVAVVEVYVREQLAMRPQDIKAVVVTHMHPDHAGGAALLRRRYGCQILTWKHSHAWYRGAWGLGRYLCDMVLAYFVARRQGKRWKNLFYSPYLKADGHLDDGQPILGFEDWQALHTPGHTDRDLSVYHPQSRAIYVADSIIRIKDKLVAPFPVHYPARYRQSLTRLMQLEVREFLLAHGEGGALSRAQLSELIINSPERPSSYYRLAKQMLRRQFSA